MKNFKYTPKQQASLLCLISIAKDSHVDYETGTRAARSLHSRPTASAAVFSVCI